MEKGMVLYVTEEKASAPLLTAEELVDAAASLAVTAVSVASSEEEAVFGWRSLVARGIKQIFFMTVAYDAALDRFESRSGPVRLGGSAPSGIVQPGGRRSSQAT